MEFKEDYYLPVGKPIDSKSIAIYVYIDGTGQVRVNIQNVSYPRENFKCNTEQGVNMDLVTFYKLMYMLDDLRDDLFFEVSGMLKNVTPFPDVTCEHYLQPGTVCDLDKDGRILCRICHKPIRNQVYMETNTKEEVKGK